MLGSSEEEKTPRRAARQRVRRLSASSEKRATRKTVRQKEATATDERKTIPEDTEEAKPARVPSKDSADDDRKAPTPFSGKKARQARLRKRNIVLAVVMIVGIGSSAAVGVTDSGQINVNETIESRNERIRNNSATTEDVVAGVVEIPVQNTNNSLPNGGLVGSGAVRPKPPIAPPVETASSTASSSEPVATSTDEVIEDEGSPVDAELENETEGDSVEETDTPEE